MIETKLGTPVVTGVNDFREPTPRIATTLAITSAPSISPPGSLLHSATWIGKPN